MGIMELDKLTLLGGGALLLVVVVIIARFGQQLLRLALVVLGLGAVIAIAAAFFQQGRATEQVATAATIATTGQTVNNAGMTVLVILLVIVLLAGVIVSGYFYLRLRRAERRTAYRHQQPRDAAGRWLSNDATCPQIHYGPPPQPTIDVNALVQLEFLHVLRDMRGGTQPPTDYVLPPYREDEGDTDEVWGWE